LPRLFYAVPYFSPHSRAAAYPWDFKLYSTGPAEEVTTALDLWNQQVVQYPKPLNKPKAKQVELFTTSLCQTIGDLWRWRLGDRVGRYHTWAESDVPPRVLELHHTFTTSWRYVFFDSTELCVPATKLLGLKEPEMHPSRPAPLGHLMNGMVEIVDYFVADDQNRIARLDNAKALDENPLSEPQPVPSVGLIKHIALPLMVNIAGQVEGTKLFFFQRQGFTRLQGELREES
jgi:hypothetical protein